MMLSGVIEEAFPTMNSNLIPPAERSCPFNHFLMPLTCFGNEMLH